MNTRLHLRVVQFAQIVSGLMSAGALIVAGRYFRDGIVESQAIFTVMVFGAFIIVQILFRTLIAPRLPARCSECGGKTYLTGARVYTCSSCRHREDLHRWGPSGDIGKKIHAAAGREVSDKQDRS